MARLAWSLPLRRVQFEETGDKILARLSTKFLTFER